MVRSITKNGVIDQGQYRKKLIIWKWKNNDYHIQKKESLNNAYVKMCCEKTHFPALQVCGPQDKPHGIQVL